MTPNASRSASSALVASGLVELAAGALSGWIYTATRMGVGAGTVDPKRIRQWHLDLAMLGTATVAAGLAVPDAPKRSAMTSKRQRPSRSLPLVHLSPPRSASLEWRSRPFAPVARQVSGTGLLDAEWVSGSRFATGSNIAPSFPELRSPGGRSGARIHPVSGVHAAFPQVSGPEGCEHRPMTSAEDGRATTFSQVDRGF
jgi:hypothetical protein